MRDLKSLPTDPKGAQFAPYLPGFGSEAKSIAAIHFDSMADFMAYVPEKDPGGDRHCDAAWTTTKDRVAFCRTPNMRAALEYARDGWKEGADRARPLLDKIKTARPVRKALVKWSVAGAIPSVPRYLSGDPMHMRTVGTAASNKQPVITLIANWSTPAFVDAKVFECVAVAAAAICDRLEDAGYRVEIIGGRRCSSDHGGVKGHIADLFARIKAPEDTMDLARVAFGLGHPSALRRLSFAIASIHPAFFNATRYGQGYATDFGNLEMPPGTYALPSNAKVESSCGTDPMKAFDYVLASLVKQGCPGLE
jgi:hypothetical protein